MKKIFFFILAFFCLLPLVNGECSYSRLKELNTLSSYIETTLDYKEDGTFTLTLTNVTNDMFVTYGLDDYTPVDGIVTVNGLTEGKQIKLYVKGSSNSECYLNDLRVIYKTIPYINPYYNNSRCLGHETLSVCTNKFLDYKISENTFNKLIKGDVVINPNENNNEEKDITFWTKILAFIKKVYIPVILVTISSLSSYFIFSGKLRKIKHGL